MVEPIERATETVTVLASPKVLEELEKGWSPVVRFKAHRLGTHWELTFMAPSPAIEAELDAVWPKPKDA